MAYIGTKCDTIGVHPTNLDLPTGSAYLCSQTCLIRVYPPTKNATNPNKMLRTTRKINILS